MIWSINLDRGVISSTHPSLNMDIYMYADDPGRYLTAHGDEVDERLAEQAGFDIAKYGRERKIKTAMAEAQAQILRENDIPISDVIEERGDFKIVDIGMDRHNVMTKDGSVLNKAPLTPAQARILLDHLAPNKKEAKEKE